MDAATAVPTEHPDRHELLLALTSSVAERGWPAATVGDVVRRADLTRERFYACFPSLSAAFEVLLAEARERLERVAVAVAEVAPDWRDFETALATYLQALADDPDEAWCVHVEAEAVRQADFEAPLSLALATAMRRRVPTLGPDAAVALGAMTERLVQQRLRQRRPDLLGGIAPSVAAIAETLATPTGGLDESW